MRGAGGVGAIDRDIVQRRRQELDRREINDQHAVRRATDQPAGVSRAAVDVGDPIVIGQPMLAGKRDAVGGAVEGRFPVKADGIAARRCQRSRARAPGRVAEIPHRGCRDQFHRRVADHRHVIAAGLGEAGDARATAVVVDHQVAAAEAVIVAQIDRIAGIVDRVCGVQCNGKPVPRTGRPCRRQVDHLRNLFLGSGLGAGQLKGVGIDRVGHDVIGAAIDQAVDPRAAAGTVDDCLAQREPMRLAQVDALGRADHRRQGAEGSAQIVLATPHTGGVEVEPQAMPRAGARVGDRVKIECVPIRRIGLGLRQLDGRAVDANHEVGTSVLQPGQIGARASIVDHGITRLESVCIT